MSIKNKLLRTKDQNKRFLLALLPGLLLFAGCNKPIDINNFDEEAWKADRKGCHNIRITLEEEIMAAKNDLLGLSHKEILGILGKPERQELYSRGQVFFIYALTPSAECKESQKENAVPPRFLYLRFSALNEVSEVFVQHR